MTLTIWLKILNNGQPWAMCLIFDLDPDPEKKTPASSSLHHKFEKRVAANFGHFALFWVFHARNWFLHQNVLNCDSKWCPSHGYSSSITKILTLFLFYFFRKVFISVSGFFFSYVFSSERFWYLSRASFQSFSLFFDNTY